MRQNRTFTFDHAFDEATTQQQVFQTLAAPLLQLTTQGYNTTLFAYGQTASGKTYSMTGTQQNPGINTRFVRALFQECNQAARNEMNYTFSVEVSYIEIYLEQVRDLLNPLQRQKTGMRIREHPRLGPYVEDLSNTACTCAEDLEAIIAQGNALRTACATRMNASSSRSHALLNITLTQQLKVQDEHGERLSDKVSKVSLVDLAGSERSKRTGSTGPRLQEAGSINKSLVALGTVISILASGKRGQHVPYRDSALTWLLKDCLGGNARAAMLATISPTLDDYSETLSTLRYADSAKKIVNHAHINVDGKTSLIEALQGEIEQLRAALSSSSATTDNVLEMREELEQALKLKAEAEMTWEEKLRASEERSAHREIALSAMEEQVRDLQKQLEESERARQDTQNQLIAMRDSMRSEELEIPLARSSSDDRIKSDNERDNGWEYRNAGSTSSFSDGEGGKEMENGNELPLEFVSGLLTSKLMVAQDDASSSGTDELPGEFRSASSTSVPPPVPVDEECYHSLGLSGHLPGTNERSPMRETKERSQMHEIKERSQLCEMKERDEIKDEDMSRDYDETFHISDDECATPMEYSLGRIVQDEEIDRTRNHDDEERGTTPSASSRDDEMNLLDPADLLADEDRVDAEFLEEVLRRLASGSMTERERMQVKLQQAQQMHMFELMSYNSGGTNSSDKAKQWAKAANALQAAFAMCPSIGPKNGQHPKVWCAVEGWLLKEWNAGQISRSWKRSWFMLVDGCILQYHRKSDMIPCCVISLSGLDPTCLGRGKRIGQQPYCLELQTSFGVHHLACESALDRDRWLTALRARSKKTYD